MDEGDGTGGGDNTGGLSEAEKAALAAKQGNADETWRATLSENLKGNESLAKFADVDALATSYLQLERNAGRSMMIPGEGATPEEWQQFTSTLIEKVPSVAVKPDLTNPEQMRQYYETMGMPKESAQYAIPEKVGDVSIKDLDHTQTNAFKEVAHRHGLTQKQFEGIVGEMTVQNIEKAKTMGTALEQDLGALRAEWGQAYDNRVRQAYLFASKTGAPEATLKALQDGKLPSATLKWLYQTAQQFTGGKANFLEDGSGDGGNETAPLVPAEAQAEFSRLMADKNAFLPTNPNREANMKRLAELQAMITPSAAA